MDNFNLTKFLAEGKLHEAMSPQDVVDIADTVAEEFTIESAEEGDFMVYSVGEMDVDNMFFELDTDVTSQTPERILKMSNLGVGEGWGGSFRINPKEEGYEVVLVNSNPATIMTDPEFADKTFIEPINSEIVKDMQTYDQPKKLPPEPLSTIGARTVIKWREFKAKAEL